jgi:hypothetical protein
VETLTITAAAELPLGRVVEIEQIAPVGAPLQVNDTGWLNPPKAVIVSEY